MTRLERANLLYAKQPLYQLELHSHDNFRVRSLSKRKFCAPPRYCPLFSGFGSHYITLMLARPDSKYSSALFIPSILSPSWPRPVLQPEHKILFGLQHLAFGTFLHKEILAFIASKCKMLDLPICLPADFPTWLFH